MSLETVIITVFANKIYEHCIMFSCHIQTWCQHRDVLTSSHSRVCCLCAVLRQKHSFSSEERIGHSGDGGLEYWVLTLWTESPVTIVSSSLHLVIQYYSCAPCSVLKWNECPHPSWFLCLSSLPVWRLHHQLYSAVMSKHFTKWIPLCYWWSDDHL